MGGQKVCRTCAKKENATLLTFLFGEEADQLELRGKIKKYTPLQLSENDCLPKSICCECKKIIISWHVFYERCSKIDNDLNLIYSGSKVVYSDEEMPSVSPLNEQVSEKTGQNTSVVEHGCAKEVVTSKPCKGFYCIAKWCNSNNTEKRMFRIPKDKRCHIWLTRAERDDLKGCDIKKLHYRYLCEDHFTDDMFTNSKRNSLVWNALPSIFPAKCRKNTSTPAKGSLNDLVMNTYGKRYRPLMCKEPELSTQSAVSQTSILRTTSLQTPQLHQNAKKAQHVLLLNADQRRIYLERDKEKKNDKSEGSLLKNAIVTNKQSHIVPENLENSNQIEKKKVPKSDNVIKAVKIIDCNQVLQSNGNNSVVDGENLLHTTGSELLVDGSLNEEDSNCNLGRTVDSNLITSGTRPVSDFIRISEGESLYCLADSRCESANEIAQKTNSTSKNPDSFGIPVVDSIDNFKDNEVDSLCASQYFREYMYPCFACGEVFLMKSSLAQHCKTYHGEKFDDSSIEVSSCTKLSKNTG